MVMDSSCSSIGPGILPKIEEVDESIVTPEMMVENCLKPKQQEQLCNMQNQK
jgi:hypothetical protein